MHRITGYGANFGKMLDKATSNLLLEPEWETILSICDSIRQGDIQPKTAVQAILKKITHDNPHTALYALLVLECCVKNCGSLIHDEVCTKQNMEQLKEIAKTTQQDVVKNKILELIQAWAFAFRLSPKYRSVQDTLRIMKAENFEFPTFKESDAMFDASIAPQWMDGENCHRCRQAFTTFNRKHHCRACGQVFCNQCSSKTSTLPKYGIEKEVRVCNTCFDTLKSASTVPKETDLPAHYLNSSLAQQQQVPPRKTEEELREEEELQIALALSQSEADHKEQEKKRATSAIISNSTSFLKDVYSPPSSPIRESSPVKEEETEDIDPELAKYLNRKYWEQRHNALDEQGSRQNVTSPSAPNIISSPMPQKITIKQENGDVDNEMDNFVKKLKSQVEIFVNRMKSNSSRGRSIANDTSVQNLFLTVTAMHSALLRYIRNQEDKRVYYEGLQDKLTQIKDGRAALDALREEHREKLLREKQEADRKKQMQMAQKLEIMRKKKQEYFEYQRELALSKVEEEKRELQMRQEIQKQQYKMGGFQPVPGLMGPMQNQASPVRHPQYIPDYNSMSPTANQSVYVYPPGTVNHYPPYIMNHHPHQINQPHTIPATQIYDPNLQNLREQPANDPSQISIPNHYPTEHSQDCMGQVKVTGPAMQLPQIQTLRTQSSQIAGQTQNVVIVPREIITPLPQSVAVNSLPPQHSQHLPQHSQSMNQVQPMNAATGNVSDQIASQQQIMLNQGNSIPRQIPLNHQIPLQNQTILTQNMNHLATSGISIPGQIVTSQMSQDELSHKPSIQNLNEINMNSVQSQLQGITISQAQNSQYQANLAQPVQVVQVKVPVEEPEGRKSPEVAELISFD